MSLEEITLVLFAASNSFRVVAYVLQILKAAGAPMDDDRFWHSFTVTVCRPRVSFDEGRPAVPMGEG
jgi:hypothetical protein